MGTIEKRGENSWRIGYRKSTADGRGWVRKNVSFPDTMSEDEQRRACSLMLARMMAQEGIEQTQREEQARTYAEIQRLIDKYGISQEDAILLRHGATAAPSQEDCPTTVQQLYDKWMELHCIPNLKPTTVKTYRNLMETRVLPRIGSRRVASLTAMDMEQLLADIRKTGKRTTAIAPELRKRKQDRDKPLPPPKKLSDRTIQHYHDTISDMFDMGVAWELIPSNPMKKATRPKARRRKLTVLDDVKAVELLRCLSTEESLSFRSAVMLALVCGLRLSEVGALCWSDVDFEQCTITVSRGLNYTPDEGNYLDTTKTEEGERTIDLPAGMMTLLAETRAQQDENAAAMGDRWRGEGRIVCGWDGTPCHHDTPSKQFRKFADANGFTGVRFHDLRHSHATLLLANNLDAVAVAHRLGHSSPDTTFRFYAHAIRSRDLASANAMQHYLDAASDTPDAPDTTT